MAGAVVLLERPSWRMAAALGAFVRCLLGWRKQDTRQGDGACR